LCGGHFGHIAVAEVDRAAGRRLQPGDAAQQGGLAAARGTEQEKQLAGFDHKPDAVQSADFSEVFHDRFGADGFHGVVDGAHAFP
jgi:hypothetical protein